MRHGDVEGVGVVVADVLPVDLARPQRDTAHGPQLFEFVRHDFVVIGRHHLRDGRTSRLQPCEHEAGVDLRLDRRQRFARDIEMGKRRPIAE